MKTKLTFFLCICLTAAVTGSCVRVDGSDPYEKDLHRLSVSLVLPESYGGDLSGTEVSVVNVNDDSSYGAVAEASGVAVISLPNGLYRVSVGALVEGERFNGSRSGIVLNGQDVSEVLNLKRSSTSDIVIKEIYSGGCMKLPAEGTYQSDSYIVLHNNSEKTVYLDSLCFGTLDPYNSNGISVWDEGIDFCPVCQAIWQFPGDGKSFPLEKGQDAVIAVFGAIDHTAQYPLSVNLNREDVFTCYSPTYFPNTAYHPAPGDKVRPERYLNVVIKTGQSNAYTFSISSPAVIFFKTRGMSAQEFVASPDNVVYKPGTSRERIVKVPVDWVLDGVEVFNGQSSVNKKRLGAEVDAGYVTLSNVHEGRSVMRLRNESRSEKLGFEVLTDTNNSSYDFYERDTQGLKDE